MISNALHNMFIAALVITIIFLLATIPYAMGYNVGYRTGQIDALNGKIHYRLEKQEDSEFIWVECPAVCDYGEGEGE